MSRIVERGKTALFLMEQLIIVAVFALAAVLCVQVFVYAHLTAEASAAQDYAVIAAENAAEIYKACRGDLDATAAELGAEVYGDTILKYYDNEWKGSAVRGAGYVMELTVTRPKIDYLQQAVVHIHSVDDKKDIFSVCVAAQEVS